MWSRHEKCGLATKITVLAAPRFEIAIFFGIDLQLFLDIFLINFINFLIKIIKLTLIMIVFLFSLFFSSFWWWHNLEFWDKFNFSITFHIFTNVVFFSDQGLAPLLKEWHVWLRFVEAFHLGARPFVPNWSPFLLFLYELFHMLPLENKIYLDLKLMRRLKIIWSGFSVFS